MTGKCEMCGCECELTKHHLRPASKCKNRYKDVLADENNIAWICRQCHDHIHATYDNNHLRDFLNTVELLMADERISSFVKWREKHPDFKGHSKMTRDNGMRRRR